MAALQIERIRQANTKAEVKKALRSMPPSLDAMYAQTVERISKQGETQAFRGLSILTWILAARRHLKVEELVHALATEEACASPNGLLPSEVDRENLIKPKDLMKVCAGLVTIEPNSGTARLVHTTAREYLERRKDSPFSFVHYKISKICIVYMSFDEFGRRPCASDEELEQRLAKFPFFSYAAKFWGMHLYVLQQQQQSTNTGDSHHNLDAYDRVQKQAKSFLENRKAIMSVNQASHLPAFKFPNYSQLYPKQVEPLHIAATFGLSSIIQLLLAPSDDNSSIDVNSKDSFGWTALHRAAENGYHDTVEVLLGRGCSVNAPATFGGTALHRAAKNGHTEIARLLLDNKAAVDAEDNYGGTPLHRAARGGHVGVATLLVDRGADRNRTYNLEVTLRLMTKNGLIAAKCVTDAYQPLAFAEARDEAAARIEAELVARERVRGGTALHEAAGAGSAALVRLLLAKGAEADAVDNYGGTALYRAAMGGHTGVISILVDEAGASVDARCHYGMLARRLTRLRSDDNRAVFASSDFLFGMMTGATPLHHAAGNGHEEAALRLLAKGADVDAGGGYIGSALAEAARNGHAGLVQILLDAGAEVDSAGGQMSMKMSRSTALHAAAEHGHDQVALVLLKAGASVNGERGMEESQCTPLVLAARGGHLAMADLLLDWGAEPDWSNETTDHTALSEAAERGDVAMARLLLRRGADQRPGEEREGSARQWLNYETAARGEFTPLYLAAAKGHAEVAKLLLQHGADPKWERQGYPQLSTLEAAVLSGSKETVEELLRAGADPSSEPCLYEAIQTFSERVAKLKGGGNKASLDQHLGLIQALLSAGANVSAVAYRGDTALHEAAATGQEHVAKLLIEHNADINASNSQGETPLYKAAEGGHPSIVQILLAAGARVEVGPSPLGGSVRLGDNLTATMLLEHNATIDPQERGKILVQAASTGVETVVRFLLELEPVQDDSEDSRQKALLAAAKGGHGAIIDVLLENGAPIEVKEEDTERTPALLAVIAGHESLVIMLVQTRPADPNARDVKTGRTVLSWAAEKGMETLVGLLLDRRGVDPNSRDVTGRTPVSWAASSGRVGILQLLLANGADPDPPGEGDPASRQNPPSPLVLAAKNGHLVVVKLLIDSGAKLTDDLTEAGGMLIAEIAHKLGHKEVARELFRQYTTRSLLYHQIGLMLAVVCEDFEFASEHIASVSAHVEGSLENYLDMAISLNRTRFASLFLQHGAKGSYPLVAAARKGNRALIRLFLDAGERANIWEAVRISLERGSFTTARLLLARIDHSKLAEREIGKTLEQAAETECEDVARSLVEDFNAHQQVDYVKQALTHAAEHGHMGILRLLLDKTGMALDLANKDHLKILSLGLAYDNSSKLLIKAVATWKGVDSASEILTNLCQSGDKQAAKLLLDKGVSPDSSRAAASPLHVACIHGHLAVAKLLLQHGASLDKRDSRWGQTGLSFAVEMRQNAVVKMLLKVGADTETRRNGDGYTPLLFAAQEGNALGARLLLADGGGALPDTPDNDGQTPLMVAAGAGHGAVARTLLELGAKIGAVDRKGMTALHYVATQGRQATARILLAHPGGVELVHREDKNGKTPLDLAKETGRVNLARLLVEKGGWESVAVPGGGSETAADEEEPRSETVEEQEESEAMEKQDSGTAGADTQIERVEDHIVAHEAEQVSNEEHVSTGGLVVEERGEVVVYEEGEEAIQTAEASSPSLWSRLRACLLWGGAKG